MYKIITRRTIGLFVLVAFLLAFLAIEFFICKPQYFAVSSQADVEKYLEDLSIEIAASEAVISEVYIPYEFSPVFEKYNDIQKQAGYNIEDYKGKNVQRITYKVMNYNAEEVTVNVLVYRNRIIGGDISSAVAGGNILPINALKGKAGE